MLMSDELDVTAPHSVPAAGKYAETRYLEYAMSVVTGRALPAVADGAKPVHRRILYAMHRMGLHRSPRHVKSARVVGDVIGKYHPHGDSSVYEAMVRMAQDWSMRYPLVDGQGNFGSRDGDNAAAMRYTEARLTPFAEVLLAELDEGTVDWLPNYDGVNEEPALLPARLPLALLNGASGIAVGMATEIPAHNLTEVTHAARELILDAMLGEEEVLDMIPGPDYPGGGQIISAAEDIRAAYRAGRGSLRVRARYTVEQLAAKAWRLIVTELPPGVSTAQVMAEIEECSNPQPKEKGGKKVCSAEQLALRQAFLSAIAANGVRDESGKETAVRLVIEPASHKQNPEDLIGLLLTHTSLETNAPLNLTVLDTTGTPRQASLYAILVDWCAFRVATVRRRTQYRLDQAARRQHILAGRLLVLSHIEQVVQIIRHAEQPKQELRATFALTEVQADDILELRLKQLARLEGSKLQSEFDGLTADIQHLAGLLADSRALQRLVAQELDADIKTYGDARRTLIEPAERKAASTTALPVTADPVTVIVSRQGWLRLRVGHRLDLTGLTFKAGDGAMLITEARNNQVLALLDDAGRVYNIPLAQIPAGRGDGAPVSSLVDTGGHKISQAWVLGENQAWLLSSTGGYGFVVQSADLLTRQKAGKLVMTLPEGAKPLAPLAVAPTDTVWVATEKHKVLGYPVGEIKQMPKGLGVQLITLSRDDKVISVMVAPDLSAPLVLPWVTVKVEALPDYLGKRARAGRNA